MPTDPLFLTTADQIGARLCRQAIWAGSACNWIGPHIEAGAGFPLLVHRACGSDLYAGTSGIALFLAHLYTLTGELIYRETALGALQQALDYRVPGPPTARWGFYSGWLGIAWAAQQVAQCCAYPAGAEAALRLVSTLAAAD